MEKMNVIKIGGNVLDNEAFLTSFLHDFSTIPGKKILVHGGGKIATKIGTALSIEPYYIEGRRVTDAPTLDLVTMVYGGLINKNIVAGLQALGVNAIGLTGADANILPAVKRPVREVDYGFVGDIAYDQISVTSLNGFLINQLVPVIAPLTHDGKGQMLNTNADTIAAALAIGLSAIYTVRLMYCFEKKGVLLDIENAHSVIPSLNQDRYKQLKSESKLFAGIIPKIDNAFTAIEHGVKEVLIGDAADMLLNISDKNAGTLITQ